MSLFSKFSDAVKTASETATEAAILVGKVVKDNTPESVFRTMNDVADAVSTGADAALNAAKSGIETVGTFTEGAVDSASSTLNASINAASEKIASSAEAIAASIRKDKA